MGGLATDRRQGTRFVGGVGRAEHVLAGRDCVGDDDSVWTYAYDADISPVLIVDVLSTPPCGVVLAPRVRDGPEACATEGGLTTKWWGGLRSARKHRLACPPLDHRGRWDQRQGEPRCGRGLASAERRKSLAARGTAFSISSGLVAGTVMTALRPGVVVTAVAAPDSRYLAIVCRALNASRGPLNRGAADDECGGVAPSKRATGPLRPSPN